MAKETFVFQRFNKGTMLVIDQANSIIGEYLSQGYSLTLRQLYYQFVARGLMENEQKNYKRLGSTLSKARLAGLVDWKALEDRTRTIAGSHGGYDDVGEFVSSFADGFFTDWWEGQENYVEIWVEKEALAGVVERAANKWRCRYFSCRGYTSQSAQYAAAKRVDHQASIGRNCIILHLGDHDPSGLDMTRDNQDRLDLLANRSDVEVRRIALNMDQVEELNPPPNPAKETDARSGEYIAQYGQSSWELDALDPNYINNLLDQHIAPLVDEELMNAKKEEEDRGNTELNALVDNYGAVKSFLENEGLL